MSELLKAFTGENSRVPVWLMRQAGRYLPEYRAIRAKADFVTMMKDSDIAAEVTCLPVHLLGVDAAILFADILTLPMAMGMDIQFVPGKGPVMQHPLRKESDTDQFGILDGLEYQEKTIQLVRKHLPGNCPLIGFAGAPFTVMTYLVEGGSSRDFKHIRSLMQEAPELLEGWMQTLTEQTIAYLQLQIQAGIQVFQLFDTWGGILSEWEYRKWILPYIQKIFQSVSLPSIYFLKNGPHLMKAMDQCGSDFLSVCEKVKLGGDPVLGKTDKGVQGNFYNQMLYEDEVRITMETEALIQNARRFKRYIFNLNHGLSPDMDPAKVKFLVELVQSFSWND